MRALLTDYQGRAIRFPEERWEHIVSSHRDMARMEQVIRETLMDPDEIYWDPQFQREVQLYYRWFVGLPIGDHLVCVAVRVFENDAFVMSSYPVRRPKGDDLIWTKSNP